VDEDLPGKQKQRIYPRPESYLSGTDFNDSPELNSKTILELSSLKKDKSGFTFKIRFCPYMLNFLRVRALFCGGIFYNY